MGKIGGKPGNSGYFEQLKIELLSTLFLRSNIKCNYSGSLVPVGSTTNQNKNNASSILYPACSLWPFSLQPVHMHESLAMLFNLIERNEL